MSFSVPASLSARSAAQSPVVTRAGTLSRPVAPSAFPRLAKRSGIAVPPLLPAAAAAAEAPPSSSSSPSAVSRVAGDGSSSSGDPWIEATLAAFDASPSSKQKLPECLASLRSESRAALSTTRMPTTRVESFKFTDISPILERPAAPPTRSEQDDKAILAAVGSHSLDGAAATLVVVDGVLREDLSSGIASNKRFFIGRHSGDGPDDESKKRASKFLGRASRERGGPFAKLNGGVASDAVAVSVAEEVSLAEPIHVLYVSTPGACSEDSAPSLSAPRLLVTLEQGAEATVVEEFCGVDGRGDGGASASTSSSPSPSDSRRLNVPVAEFFLAEGSTLNHSYVELEGSDTWHAKETLVDQAEESSYRLTEARAGGRASISRADVDVSQLGPETSTSLRSFILAGQGQLVDLHTRLSMEHPRGEADQLHKAIAASATSRAVFDGGVRVGRAAQQTDAQQLSRNLLLSPRATVNVKPNLQIVADDVKCTHGCAVSDLEEDQMFYFKSRGVDGVTARRVLVQSFGAEVTAALPGKDLRRRVEAAAGAALAGVVELDAASSSAAE